MSGQNISSNYLKFSQTRDKKDKNLAASQITEFCCILNCGGKHLSSS